MELPVLHRVSDWSKQYDILGTYGKAIAGSVSCNFGVSGGSNCHGGCPYKGSLCYAKNTEKRFDRRELRAKLARHEHTSPVDILRRAKQEVWSRLSRGVNVPWFRFSTNGSLPTHPSKAFRAELRSLLGFLRANDVPVHLPIETAGKARMYRRIVCGRAVVRESCVSETRFVVASGAVSYVAGTREMTRLERVTEARELCRARTEVAGRKCIVCPAVAARYLNGNKPSDKAKCGNCTACASASVDVVYPLH